MRLFTATLILSLLIVGADAQPARHFSVPTPRGQVLVESFEDCAKASCPAMLISSGSKGYEAAPITSSGRYSRRRVECLPRSSPVAGESGCHRYGERGARADCLFRAATASLDMAVQGVAAYLTEDTP